ncbi:UDP-glycosyltransferase 79B3-like [Camellia sinensis]|uniref:UDP-glycosyltransferase 79B3-like n=1 Tax=Camellia sinensis TaxID=4442 RepID=UPI0010364055|nr:UDP-glycosyltransferase 79B3-like [Camellia sinensis]
MKECDAISIRTCQQIEGQFCDYIGSQYGKPVFLTGPVLHEVMKMERPLEDRWARWLEGFERNSVVFCAFGSQLILEKDQFQELVLGFELTGLPFLVALKPPAGAATVEEALPKGFKERLGGRGVVYGGWVQHPQILGHPSVGCFVNHCGFGSMWESLLSNAQIVLVPHLCDQILNTRLMAEELKVAVEVARDENGWFLKESLCESICSVMDKDNEMGKLVKKNHLKWKETLTSQGFMTDNIDRFEKQLHELSV